MRPERSSTAAAIPAWVIPWNSAADSVRAETRGRGPEVSLAVGVSAMDAWVGVVAKSDGWAQAASASSAKAAAQARRTSACRPSSVEWAI